MALDIGKNGIVQRHEGGAVTIVRPHRNGGPAIEIEVPEKLADEYRLATGDIVQGATEPTFFGLTQSNDEDAELEPGWDTQWDEPSVLSREGPVTSLTKRRDATERLVTITRINDLDLSEAEDRPFARSKRSSSERVPPDQPFTLATEPDDYTGRMLDFAAPLGAGMFGLVYGAHGAGLSRTLQSALKGIVSSMPDVVPLVLLLRPRAEEATEWRRRVPEAEIVAASSAFDGGAAEDTLRICSLVLEAAQRQTELGRDVVLLVDSLTALWAALLEFELADAQHEADTSSARVQIREWAARAGCFHGSGPLGGGLGGTLTILGSVWHQGIDIQAEEERDTHPHLRLLEHLLPEAGWLVALSEPLMEGRLFPAIDIKRCRSNGEERLLPKDLAEEILTVRGSLPRKDPVAAHLRTMEAFDRSKDTRGFLEALKAINKRAQEKEAEEGEAPRYRTWPEMF